MNEKIRVQKLLSARGFTSRRSAEEMILDGRVTVNGRVCRLGDRAFETDLLCVDGKEIAHNRGENVYIMLNKPRGYVATMSDERGRKNVTELIDPALGRVYPVGRLDVNSEGLLLLTNDGEFANAVTHPSKGIAKCYRVSVKGDISNGLPILSRPLEIDGYTVQAVSVKLIREDDNNGGLLSVTIREGRNRQIRKMCDIAGLKVSRLIRVSVGDLVLGDLKTGKYRKLTKPEILKMYRSGLTPDK